jgi:hypothetical protein
VNLCAQPITRLEAAVTHFGARRFQTPTHIARFLKCPISDALSSPLECMTADSISMASCIDKPTSRGRRASAPLTRAQPRAPAANVPWAFECIAAHPRDVDGVLVRAEVQGRLSWPAECDDARPSCMHRAVEHAIVKLRRCDSAAHLEHIRAKRHESETRLALCCAEKGALCVCLRAATAHMRLPAVVSVLSSATPHCMLWDRAGTSNMRLYAPHTSWQGPDFRSTPPTPTPQHALKPRSARARLGCSLRCSVAGPPIFPPVDKTTIACELATKCIISNPRSHHRPASNASKHSDSRRCACFGPSRQAQREW